MTDHTSLAATLRVWRQRLTPDKVGLPARSIRRTTGLRREDLAERSGLSVDYIVRLEQGRATAPSVQAVAALAAALQLSPSERDHLYHLASLRPPIDQRMSHRITPGVQRLLTRLGDVPISVFAADWQQIWWNASWAALIGDPAEVAPEHRNFVASRFPIPDWGGRVEAWPVRVENLEASKRSLVADLRHASARYPADPRLAVLLCRLLGGNQEFAAMWRSGAVGEHTEDRKVIEHPVVGHVQVDCDVLTAGDADLRIVALTAEAGTIDARRLEQTRYGVGTLRSDQSELHASLD
ncbi:helix-turn-helix transcriptional regulator (plasmid) [Deinococcus sp. KNUC1210]|uniref:helix-turn-helix domain-containing protein n=1 Tax=Deinococcus sp. KNUC1210 TaxID=2917691 RepID=UPI001EF0A188|nr:helix-turn-helix transcriptional regulator [Deinococcus sp. KNUC1210]ULH18078.1 helix-turn-helix transcriptional regulator [Deinococcus sp. KNUC1210]